MKIKIPRPPSAAEELFSVQLRGLKIPFEREVRFHPVRKWRWDFTLGGGRRRLAMEIEGMTAAGGRHQRIGGRTSDIEKHNSGVLDGWTVLYATSRHVEAGTAIQWVEKALEMPL